VKGSIRYRWTLARVPQSSALIPSIFEKRLRFPCPLPVVAPIGRPADLFLGGAVGFAGSGSFSDIGPDSGGSSTTTGDGVDAFERLREVVLAIFPSLVCV
jgi:hypothetical protein